MASDCLQNKEWSGAPACPCPGSMSSQRVPTVPPLPRAEVYPVPSAPGYFLCSPSVTSPNTDIPAE